MLVEICEVEERTMGSVKLSVKGRTRDIMAISFPVICCDMSSGSQVNFSSPVSFRRRRVRRMRMLLALVSGRRKNRTTRQNPDSHISSQIGHVQGAVMPPPVPPYWTAYPPTSGPSVGPQMALMPQMDMA